MSRNTFILLGLLTGSIAMIGCSKNITAPSVETDHHAQALTNQAVPEPVKDDMVEGDLGGVSPISSDGWKGNKLRFNDLDLEISGDTTNGRMVTPKPINPAGPKGKLRFNQIDGETGDLEGAPVRKSETEPVQNKWRQMQMEVESGQGVESGSVAPAPDPTVRDDF